MGKTPTFDTQSIVNAFKEDPFQFFGIIIALLIIVGVRIWVRPRLGQNPLHQKQIQNKQKGIQLTEINVYPIKSCHGIQVDKWKVGQYGLENDRRWMLIDENNRFISQRKFSRLCFIVPSFEGGKMLVNAPDMPTLTIPLSGKEQSQGPIIDVTVWKDTCRAVLESDKSSKWFSDFLKEQVRLVRFCEEKDRLVEEKYQVEGLPNLTVFSDGYPLLMISEESLRDLNSRLGSKGPLPMSRFRPNLVIKASNEQGTPFMEDFFQKVRIGAVIFYVRKKCTRCKMTTVNGETGEYSNEPLETLKTFRKGLLETSPQEVCFGQNIIHDGEGEISVGQEVKVLE